MSDFISEDNKTYDGYAEHALHTEYDEHCSTCFEVKKHLENCTPDLPCKLCEEKYAVTCGKGTMYPDTCELAKCVGCGGRATRTNNTLCNSCWKDCEGQE